MFDFYLPLADHFMQVMLKNEIQNWEAKKFWLQFDQSKIKNHARHRQYMYSSLKILAKHGFLEFKYSENNSRLYLYSETEKLKKMRYKHLDKDYENIFNIEKENLIIQLDGLSIKNKYISELNSKYPEFRSKIIEIENKIHLKKKEYEIKLQFLEDFKNI
ncbi:hypothetical protein HXZ72_08455 [Acinetobacter indicus]|nr:hypothetical protein [Acinetobacter indicus]